MADQPQLLRRPMVGPRSPHHNLQIRRLARSRGGRRADERTGGDRMIDPGDGSWPADRGPAAGHHQPCAHEDERGPPAWGSARSTAAAWSLNRALTDYVSHPYLHSFSLHDEPGICSEDAVGPFARSLSMYGVAPPYRSSWPPTHRFRRWL